MTSIKTLKTFITSMPEQASETRFLCLSRGAQRMSAVCRCTRACSAAGRGVRCRRWVRRGRDCTARARHHSLRASTQQSAAAAAAAEATTDQRTAGRLSGTPVSAGV